MKKPLRKITRKELDIAIADHNKWLNTSGKEGKQADLSYTDLKHFEFSSVNLSQAIFKGSDLTGCLLKECFFNKADFENAIMVEAKVIETEMIEANLANINLSHSIIKFSNLTNTTITNGILSNSFIYETLMTYASEYSLCGYVGITNNLSSLCKQSYNNVFKIGCHFGINFVSENLFTNNEGDLEKLGTIKGQWFGWDYNHSSDASFYSSNDKRKKWLVKDVIQDSQRTIEDFRRLLISDRKNKAIIERARDKARKQHPNGSFSEKTKDGLFIIKLEISKTELEK